MPLTIERIDRLSMDDDLAERVDAFVAHFGRLQNTLGDKLLPAFLAAMAETPRAALENLDRAEKLGLIQSADAWLALRKLRNRMIHDYVNDTKRKEMNVASLVIPAWIVRIERPGMARPIRPCNLDFGTPCRGDE